MVITARHDQYYFDERCTPLEHFLLVSSSVQQGGVLRERVLMNMHAGTKWNKSNENHGHIEVWVEKKYSQSTHPAAHNANDEKLDGRGGGWLRCLINSDIF